MTHPLFLLTAFALGAMHAFEPGHGKTLVTAFLMTQQELAASEAKSAVNTVKQAMSLGILMTLVHTLSSLLLGIVSVFALSTLQSMLPVNAGIVLARSFGVLAGLIVLSWGWRQWLQQAKQKMSAAGNTCHCPSHSSNTDSARTDQKSLFWVAVGSGLTPCPLAITALVTALSLGSFQQLYSALAYLVLFSMGLASVVILIGVFGGLASHKLGKIKGWIHTMQPYRQWLFFGIGLYLILLALWGPVEVLNTSALHTSALSLSH